MLQRVKEVQESDLRMDGALARNIQRVIAVTQAQIDAAAAQGRAWVVKPVVKVSDPIDNLRGGTQLVIKQNSILPGQNVMRVIYMGGTATVVGPGTSPLSLPDAIDGDIVSLKAFGGTYQGLPAGYDPVQFIYFLDGAYLLTDLVPASDCKVEMDFATTTVSGNGDFFLGIRNTSDYNSGFIFGASTPSREFFINGFSTRYQSNQTVADNRRYKLFWNNGVATIYQGSSAVATNTFTPTETLTYPLIINGLNTAGTASASPSGIYLYSFKMWNPQGQMVAHYVPCAKTNPLTVGLYDLVSKTFINAPTSGTWAAGPAAGATDPAPTPDAPIDIVCNNGVLKARHQSGLPLGYTLLDYIESTGTQLIDLGLKWTYGTSTKTVCEMLDRQTTAVGCVGARNSTAVVWGNFQSSTDLNYTCFGNKVDVMFSQNMADGNYHIWETNNTGFYLDGVQKTDLSGSKQTLESTDNIGLFGRYDGAGNIERRGKWRIKSHQTSVDNTLTQDLIPAKRNSDSVIGMYDTVSGQFFTNAGTGDFVAGDPVSDPVEIYADGLVETIKDSLNNTATAEMLLKVGDYQDAQSIIDGAVTRKVGVLVFDGTENWVDQLTSANPRVVLAIGDILNDNTAPLLVTHGAWSLSGSAGSNVWRILLGGYISCRTSEPTLADFKQYLATQYAAGTPVIVVYPLETSTSETVTGQPMQTTQGDNIVEITQASLNGLELQVTYMKQGS